MIILVLGMHRSGTSALAGLLHKSGIIMGNENTFIPGPSIENPRGFFENYEFRKINDALVEHAGYKIKSWHTDIPQINTAYIGQFRMLHLLKRYHREYDSWGWKDPRTCLTAHLWFRELGKLHILNECRVLYIHREPAAVALSMEKRGNTTFNRALELWYIYNYRAIKSISDFNVETHYIRYEDLIRSPIDTAKHISRYLDHNISDEIVKQYIDIELDNFTKDTHDHQYNDSINSMRSILEQKSQ